MSGRFITCLVIIAFIAGCSGEDDLSSVSVGHNFIKPQTNIAVVDTFSVQLSTILIDSIPTSGGEVLMVGRYTDDEFGEISSTGFFQLGISDTLDVHDEAVYDSLLLVMKYTGESYGDTLQPQTINVYRVLEEIEELDDGSLYNSSSFCHGVTPIGSVTDAPKPNFDNNLKIRLSDELGQEIFGLMKDNSDEFSTLDGFVDYLKGLAVEPGPFNTSILAFHAADSFLNVVLYAHYAKEERIEVEYNFPLKSSTTCFNHIEADRRGTFIEKLETQKKEIPSGEAGGRAFIQAGAGIVARLDIPGLSKLLEFDINNILYKAEVVLKPYPLSSKDVGLPEEIVFYTTDRYNRLLSEIVTDEGYSIPATLYQDELYNENTYYTYDITDFIMDELSDSYFDPDNGLIMVMPEDKFHGSLERLVIDARNDVSTKPLVKLYFLFYE